MGFSFLFGFEAEPLGNSVCYNVKSARALGSSYTVVTSVAACLTHAKGYTYFAMGCPHSKGIECWYGNDVNSGAIEIGLEECSGTLTTDIGNGKDNGHCSGYPNEGDNTEVYNGVEVALGGWAREVVYEREAFDAATQG